jgi:hypothetical protein
MAASIILYSQQGDPFPALKITLQPEETRHIDVVTLLPPRTVERNVGGLAITFVSNLPSSIGAQLTISDFHGFGSIDLPVFPDMMYKSNDADAVWWEPLVGKSYLILGNSSAIRLHAEVTFADGTKSDLDIESHATLVQAIPAAGGRLGSGRINSFHLVGNGPVGALRISGLTASEIDGYVSTIRAFDPQSNPEAIVYANGIHFSESSNHLVVKNLSQQSVSITGTLYPILPNGVQNAENIPVKQLPANASAELDLTGIPSGQILDGAAIKLQSNGPPASLIASYSSHEASAKLTRSVPFKTLGDASLANGAYPWRIDGNFQSRVYITNVGTSVGKIAGTLRSENGPPFAVDTRPLQPGETAVYDIRQLRDDEVMDANGVKLRKDATVGQFDWTSVFNDGTQRFIARNEVVDRATGVSASFSCPTCSCPASFTSGFATPSNLVVSQGGISNVVSTGVSTCAGTVFIADFSINPSSWTYGVNGIVRLTTGSSPSILTGMAAGSSSFTTTLTGNLVVYEGPITGCVTMSPPSVPISGSGNVMPTITGANTLWWFNGLGAGVSGYQNQITLTANSGGTGTSYQWAITAGSSKVSLSTSTSATVQVTSIGESTLSNDVSITVSVGGQTSNPFKITVHAPYSLGTDPSEPTPTYSRDPNFVWNIKIPYLILDNFLNAMPNPIPVNENWLTAIIPDYTGENWTRGPALCATTSSSFPASFADSIGGETPTSKPTPVFNMSENGPAVNHWGQEWRVGTCTIGSGPRVQTDTLRKYTDHAAHTGITSPAP